MLAMAKLHIHHLPVMEDGRLAGMITSTDLLERRSSSAVFVIGDIYKRNSAAELAEVSKQIPKVLTRLQGASASAHSIGHVISSIGEAITCRLLELAEEKLGPPPVPYAFVVEGSMARHEQTALSDQDNGLLLSDEFRPEEHDEYFLAMAKFVCDGLDACGYEYCRGEIMATTPKWRQPLSVWKSYFDRWIDQPEPMALMHSSIFFDMRAIYGDVSLFEELNKHVLAKSAGNKIFLSYMASNAMALRPPLGLFGSFVLIRGGEHHKTLDLKHNGVVPIIDLARIYALSGGVPAVNTRDRLEAAAGGEVSRDGAADLREALEFISTVRIAHQANAVRMGEPPDNFVPPGQLSAFERSHLKDAFALVRSMQATLEQRYQTGRLR
jgi:CBS domain-containing protein